MPSQAFDKGLHGASCTWEYYLLRCFGLDDEGQGKGGAWQYKIVGAWQAGGLGLALCRRRCFVYFKEPRIYSVSSLLTNTHT